MNIVFIIIALILTDQITKLAVRYFLKSSLSISLIDKIFYLTYKENRGAAFSLFQNKQIFIILLSIGVCSYLIYFLYKNKIKKDKKPKLLNLSIILIISGTIGNLIDRIKDGYVTDFLNFNIFNFPIFNFADCYIVIGCLLLGYYIIVKDLEKENE